MFGLFLFLQFGVFYCVHSEIVKTTLGDLDGGTVFTKNGGKVFTFLGVPYAEPPVGEGRFREPSPVRGWPGVRSAKEHSLPCVQYTTHFNTNEEIRGEEDCLYLNIFTKTISNSSNLPVLVFIHGGAFMEGSGNWYRSDYLLKDHDLVFVTINYRLGPFGFLSTEDDVVPGNNGLKDQNMALKWIHEHIAVFGGDHKKVTISGNSAGGASVHYHFLSTLSRGLFIRGISSSGSALMPWAFTENPLMKAQIIAAAVNCSTTSTAIMVKCLKQKSTHDILSTVPLFQPWIDSPFSPFGPVIEISNTNPFLGKHPYQLMSEGDTFDVPWLVSITTEEGLYPAGMFIDREELLQSLDKDWDTIAPHLLDFNYTVPSIERLNVSRAIKKHYLANEEISSKNSDKTIRMLSDRMFDAGMNLAARMQASVMRSPVYMFRFGYMGNTSLSDEMTKTKAKFGVSHCDDLYYVLAMSGTTELVKSEQTLIRKMTNIWASFVKTGYPSPVEGEPWEPVQRDSVQTGELTHLLIHGPENMAVTRTLNLGDLKFWSSLGLNENENFKINVNSSLNDLNRCSRHVGSIYVIICICVTFCLNIWF